MSSEGSVSSSGTPVAVLTNPHLAALHPDTFYHLGFDSGMPLKTMFGDVKFVLFGGSNDRMERIANEFAETFWPLPLGQKLEPIGSTTRYHMYKVGPIISVSHQMGMPSFSILLHEITKLLVAAGATDVTYLRIGTSGGVGVPGGTIVVTDGSVSGVLEPYYELISLGKRINRPSVLSPAVRDGLIAAGGIDIPVVTGHTMSVDCFYEGQGRLDGAICHYAKEDKFAFLEEAARKGVKNIEMESLMFGAFCHELKIKGGVICCTLLNRLEGDQVTMTNEQYKTWVGQVLTVVKRYVAKELGLALPYSISPTASPSNAK